MPEADEFAGIPSPRTRHPALAAATVVLAGALVFHMRADLGYALSSGTPTDLGQARTAFAPGAPSPAANRYVTVAGVPDRESGVTLDTQGSWEMSQFFRVLGTGSRLFVHRLGDPLPRERAERDAFAGRLLRFSDLSFSSSIRSYFASHVSATHVFARDDVAAAAGRPSASLRDLAGDTVAVGGADVLAIEIDRPDQVRLSFPRERFVDEAAARAEIVKHGGTVVGPAADPEPDRHALVASFPAAQRDAELAAIGDLDRRILIAPARQSHKTRLPDLKAATRDPAQGPGLEWKDAAGATVFAPLRDVVSVRTLAAVDIPADAFLVVEGDRPQDHVATVLVAIALLAFAVVTLLGLRRGLRAA